MRALELNPTLWTAYEKLLKMGENVLPNNIFTENKYKLYEKTRKPSSQIRPKKATVPEPEPSSGGQRARRSQNAVQFGAVAQRTAASDMNPTQNIIGLLKRLADPFFNLSIYNCVEAIE